MKNVSRMKNSHHYIMNTVGLSGRYTFLENSAIIKICLLNSIKYYD